tara:strand:- start:196 stop:1224 length:1029 start_codon:yes stop_codon:yes gene_type:complete
MAKGLDCGTSFYLAATETSLRKQRNAFLTVDGDFRSVTMMLKRQKIPFVQKGGKIHILGQHAFNYAQIFSKTELRRPMKSGLLNPNEKDALTVLHSIIEELLGKSENNEVCVYCIPADPIDQDRRVDYHKDILKTIIEGFGYKATKIEEPVAIGYEGLIDDDLTGIAISMGAGMCNVAVMYQGMTAVSFSVARGGDWVDQNVAADTGIQVAKAQHLKEQSVLLNLKGGKINDIYDENDEDGNIIRAIRSYYGTLINYLMTNLKNQFESRANVPQFPNPVPIVIGGGTSLVSGFIDIFKEAFDDSNFPIEISEIRLIEDAHTAVARGCLSEAQLIEEQENEDK